MLQNLLQECSVLCKTSLSLRCLLDEVFARFASVFRAFVCKRASCLSRPCSTIFILPVHARYVFSCALQRIPLLPCHWLHVNGFVNWDLFPLAYLRHTKFNVTLLQRRLICLRMDWTPPLYGVLLTKEYLLFIIVTVKQKLKKPWMLSALVHDIWAEWWMPLINFWAQSNLLRRHNLSTACVGNQCRL